MGEMSGFLGKILIGIGLFIIVLGVFLLIGPRIPFLGKLPGDLIIHRDNVTFYFPVATSILLSIVLTIILNLLSR